MRLLLETASVEQTQTLAASLARGLRPGDFIGLEGGMGAGKTHFVQGLCRGLEVPEGEVSSPTYALVNFYQGRLPVFHVDLYRVSGMDELEETGLLETSVDGVCVVEWIDRVPEFCPPSHLWIKIQMVDESRRRLELEGPPRLLNGLVLGI